MGGTGGREVGYAKKPFYAKRSLRKRASWKITCDVDRVVVDARKKIPTTLEGKLKRDFVTEANFRLTILSTFLTFIC